MNKTSKITVLGAGNVGATIAYTLCLSGTAAEIVLVDINKDKANGEAMDIEQGSAFLPASKIISGDYSDTVGSDIVIVTVGSARKP
jgi:L-lactate dehydrogenase